MKAEIGTKVETGITADLEALAVEEAMKAERQAVNTSARNNGNSFP